VSDGTSFENPGALKKALVKIKRLQRTVSRRGKGSANRGKARQRLARAHARVANIRRDALHQATSRLTTLAPARSAGGTRSAVVLEDLNVGGMLKNHHLAQAIADVGLGEFRRQLSYKGGVVRLPGRDRRPLLPLHQTLLKLRAGEGADEPGRARIPLRELRAGHRPRPERGHQFGAVAVFACACGAPSCLRLCRRYRWPAPQARAPHRPAFGAGRMQADGTGQVPVYESAPAKPGASLDRRSRGYPRPKVKGLTRVPREVTPVKSV